MALRPFTLKHFLSPLLTLPPALFPLASVFLRYVKIVCFHVAIKKLIMITRVCPWQFGEMSRTGYMDVHMMYIYILFLVWIDLEQKGILQTCSHICPESIFLSILCKFLSLDYCQDCLTLVLNGTIDIIFKPSQFIPRNRCNRKNISY